MDHLALQLAVFVDEIRVVAALLLLSSPLGRGRLFRDMNIKINEAVCEHKNLPNAKRPPIVEAEQSSLSPKASTG